MAIYTEKVEDYTYDSFLKLINRCRFLKRMVSELRIDIREIDFIKPYHVVIIACLIEEYDKAGKIASVVNAKPKVDAYLNEIKFYNYWKPGFDRDNYTRVNIETTLCLWHISKPMISGYIDYAVDYYENNFFKGKDLYGLHNSLAEIFNNIFDHSESPIDGYVLTQFYPKENNIIVSVCDFGIGIPTKINQFRYREGKDLLDDNDALLKALQDGFTTQSTTHNRGYGLNNLLRISESMNGVMKIVSNGVYYLCDFRNNSVDQTFILERSFQGTLLIIELDTGQFDDSEDDINEILDF